MNKFNIGDIVFCRKKDCGYRIITDMTLVNTCLSKKCVRMTHIPYQFRTSRECFMLLDKYYEKQSVRKIQCSERDFKLLKQMHGIGCFYHDLSPVYEKLCTKPPKFVIFRNVSTKQQLIFHLGKATKVLKRIGFEHNGNYERVRVVKPMVRLQFIGEL